MDARSVLARLLVEHGRLCRAASDERRVPNSLRAPLLLPPADALADAFWIEAAPLCLLFPNPPAPLLQLPRARHLLLEQELAVAAAEQDQQQRLPELAAEAPRVLELFILGFVADDLHVVCLGEVVDLLVRK